MSKITKEQYEFAQSRIEELLPLVDDNTPANDKNAVELTMMSDIVIAYEKEHFPIEKPTVAELIELSLEEKGMTQKQLASEIGVSPSRVNDYIAGRSEPTLKIARMLCRILNIRWTLIHTKKTFSSAIPLGFALSFCLKSAKNKHSSNCFVSHLPKFLPPFFYK